MCNSVAFETTADEQKEVLAEAGYQEIGSIGRSAGISVWEIMSQITEIQKCQAIEEVVYKKQIIQKLYENSKICDIL